MEDQELKELLHEWKAPNAPPHLRPRPVRRPRLGWLITGTIRVPVPAMIVALLLVVLWVTSTRSAPRTTHEAAGPGHTGEIARHPLQGPLEGYDAVLAEMNFAPGYSSPEHRHPGFILGYVIDGQMRFAIDHLPDQIVPAGGTFFEPPGALHTTFGSANPDAPVRCVVFLVVPRGSPLTARAEGGSQ